MSITNDGLGIDLALDGGDLALSGSGDYQLVGGPQNLAQALSLLIPTNPGDYVWDAAYGAGIGAYVDAGMSPEEIAQATSQLTGAALGDPRVASILQATLTPNATDAVGVDVLLEVQPSTSGGTPITVTGRVGA